MLKCTSMWPRSIHTAALAAVLLAGATLAPRAALATDWLTGVGSPTQQLGAEDNLFLDLDSGRVFRKSQGTWVNMGMLRAGALGWRSGSGSPTPELGNDGDMYLDIVTGRAYKKTNGTWLFLADLKGAQGVKGDPGPAGAGRANACANLHLRSANSSRPTRHLHGSLYGHDSVAGSVSCRCSCLSSGRGRTTQRMVSPRLQFERRARA